MDEIEMKWMVIKHMPQVLEIERQAFEYPWDSDRFKKQMREYAVIGMVAVNRHQMVVGYIVYELFKSGIDILNLAVDPHCQRQGVGTTIINAMKSKIQTCSKRNRLTCLVRETNLDAQLFMRSQGFRAVNVIRNYYDDPATEEDAYQMLWHSRKYQPA